MSILYVLQFSRRVGIISIVMETEITIDMMMEEKCSVSYDGKNIVKQFLIGFIMKI